MPIMRRFASASRARSRPRLSASPAALPASLVGRLAAVPRPLITGALFRHRRPPITAAPEPKEQSMSHIIQIPLNKLALWDGNVRKTGINTGIEELAASIAAHGLLQSLVVRKSKRGKYGIVAGQRRFLALQALVKDGILGSDCAIPCMLVEGEIDPAELSLAENVVRTPMHPADQFEAFKVLIDKGASIADVAARFGVAESVVSKRLTLGRLSPVILNAYRDGDIDLDEAQAFAVSDDHAAQDRVFGELSEWNRSAHTIRRMLTEGEIPTSDKRVRFVGIDAYRAAGGAIRQDLFDDSDAGYVQDAVLLDRLVSEKLSGLVTELSAEGWSWVEGIPDADYGTFGRFKRVYPERAPLSDADQAELARLGQEYDNLLDCEDADQEQLDEIDARINALNNSSESWPAETLAIAGAIVTLGYDGEVRIERGLVRKEDAHKLSQGSDGTVGGSTAPADQANQLSPRLIEDLTAQRSAAIGAELMGQPRIALAAVVHAMALEVFYAGYGTESGLKLHIGSANLRGSIADADDCKGLAAIEQERERLCDHLPGDPAHLWAWLLDRAQDELLDLLAFVAATSVDGVQRKLDRPGSSRLTHANALSRSLELDMAQWFKPTSGNYFAHITRERILADIDDATGAHAPALEKLKKSELAVRAEQLVSGTSWLPQPLRSAVNDNDGQQALAAE
jgi:ParB family chromosome partitioning protein